jgi:hypothetical protein
LGRSETVQKAISVIKSRSIRWEEYVARRGKMINACRLLVGSPEAKIQLIKIISKRNSKK